MNAIEYPYWVWIMFFAVVLTALFVDIGIVNRKSHAPTRKETILWSIVWISIALAFNIFIYFQFGLQHAKLFLTGYLIELSLSVDNLFVFLLIFTFFKVPKKFQHRVLFWGIMGALVMRMIMIFAGADRIAANGDTANKIGTYMLAVLAKHHKIPFYIVAPRSTFDLVIQSGRQIPIEERKSEEVTNIQGYITAPKTVNVYNPAFDVTDAALITGIVTEFGVINKPGVRNICRIMTPHSTS